MTLRSQTQVPHREDSEAKVHAMLSDFDCARILDSAKQRADLDQGRGEITVCQ